MGPDFRVLVRKSRKQAQQYYGLYKETIPDTQLVQETAAVMQEFTQSGLIHRDRTTTGKHQLWRKMCQNAKTFLEKRYEGQISSNNIEIGIIRSDREFKYVIYRIKLFLLPHVYLMRCSFCLCQRAKSFFFP